MASDLEFIEFIVEQIENVGVVTFRKMFGEYAIYCNKKVVALVCENQLFVEPTEAGKLFIGKVDEVSPYKGAKPSFLIKENIENRGWLSNLIEVTVLELPEPKPKVKSKNRKTKEKINESKLCDYLCR